MFQDLIKKRLYFDHPRATLCASCASSLNSFSKPRLPVRGWTRELGSTQERLMKRYLLAAMVSVSLVSFVMSEEFTLQITGIGEDGSVTGKKIAIGKGGFGGGGKGGFGKAEEVTVKMAKDVKVHKGKFDMDAKGFVADGDNLKL